MSRQVLDRVFYTVLSTQILLTIVQLAILSNFKYDPTFHGVIVNTIFAPEKTVSALLFTLFIAWSIIMASMRKELVLFPLLSFLLYPFFSLDLLLVFTSVQCILATFFFYDCISEVKKRLLEILIASELLILLYWLLLLPLKVLWIRPLALVEEGLFYLLGKLTALSFILLLAGWLIPLIPKIRNRINTTTSQAETKYTPQRIKWILSGFIILGVVCVLYPYLPQLNPDGLPYGRDLPKYQAFIEQYGMDLEKMFEVQPDRLGLHLVFYVFRLITGLDIEAGLQLLPVIFVPMVAVSMFYLAREMFMDDEIAAWTGFLTLTGYYTTVGLASFFLSNLLGFIQLNSSLFYLFRARKTGNKKEFLLAAFLGAFLYITHPWTLFHYVGPLGVLWLIELMRSRKLSLNDFSLWYFIVLGMVVVLGLLLGLGGGVSVASSDLSSRLLFDMHNVRFNVLYGGYLRVFPLLALGIIGYYTLGVMGEYHKFLHVFMFLSSIIYLAGNEILKSRILYNLPIGLFAALGYTKIRRKLQEEVRLRLDLFTVLMMLVYLFRSVINLV